MYMNFLVIPFKVKYGIRKLNAETRMCSCILRFACATTALYWALRYHDIPFGTLIKVIWEYRVWDGPRFYLVVSSCRQILAIFLYRLLQNTVGKAGVSGVNKWVYLVHP